MATAFFPFAPPLSASALPRPLLTDENRVLDSQLAEAMGLHIAGWTTCAYVEGDWSIHFDSDPDGWACHAEKSPVYVNGCCCDALPHQLDVATYKGRRTKAHIARYNKDERERFERERAALGHSTLCLAVVPTYSTSIAEFALVEQAIHNRGRGVAYVRKLAELLTISFDAWPLHAAWDLTRAPLRDKARAALFVLAL